MNIESINSAWKLGDRRLPPPKSRVLYARYHGLELEGLLMGARYDASPEGSELVIKLLVAHLGISRLRLQREDTIEVLSLPDGCPPFEEWPRLTPSEREFGGLLCDTDAMDRMGMG